jgi:hypothetical protein
MFPISNPIAAWKQYRANAKHLAANQRAMNAAAGASNVVPFPGAGNTNLETLSTDELIKKTMVEASQLTDVYEPPLDKGMHFLFALLS